MKGMTSESWGQAVTNLGIYQYVLGNEMVLCKTTAGFFNWYDGNIRILHCFSGKISLKLVTPISAFISNTQ